MSVTDRQSATSQGESELIHDTFEPRRQEIVSEFNRGDPKYEVDEHTEYDLDALKSLHRIMLALLSYEPEDRAVATDALKMADWVDYRREDTGSNIDKE